MIEKDYGTGVCVQCGRPFKKINGIQRYCGMICKKKAQNQQNRDWMRRYHEEMRQMQKKAKQKKDVYASFKELADMNEKARAAGYSYGQYVALLREGRIDLGN